MEKCFPTYFCFKEDLRRYISGLCWTWICPLPPSPPPRASVVLVHTHNLFYKSLILHLLTEAGVLTPMFDTIFSSKVFIVAFSSGISPYFFNFWSFPETAFYWQRRKIGKELKTHSRHPHSKFHWVSSLLFFAPGFALCISEGVRVDLHRVLFCSTTTIFLLWKAPSKELASFRGFLSEHFNNWIFSVSFFGEKINRISWQSEKKYFKNISDYFSALLLGWQLLGTKTEDDNPFRGSEFTCSLYNSEQVMWPLKFAFSPLKM